MFEQEQQFMSTVREQTGRFPYFGQTGDEVSLLGRTFDLEQYQCLDAGRPKQLHLKAEEVDAETITGQSLFDASRKNFRLLTKQIPDEKHIEKANLGRCWDGGGPYQGTATGIKGLCTKANKDFKGKHDRMHQHNLVLKKFLTLNQFRFYEKVIKILKRPWQGRPSVAFP